MEDEALLSDHNIRDDGVVYMVLQTGEHTSCPDALLSLLILATGSIYFHTPIPMLYLSFSLSSSSSFVLLLLLLLLLLLCAFLCVLCSVAVSVADVDVFDSAPATTAAVCTDGAWEDIHLVPYGAAGGAGDGRK